MLIFIDESGDCGMRDRRSAPYFTLSAVLFETLEMAQKCEEVIRGVRKTLVLPEHFEFHFSRISDLHRKTFFNAVSPCEFLYAVCTLNKERLDGRQWRDKEFFYERAVERLVGCLEEYLHLAQASKDSPLSAKVTADDNADRVYFRVLEARFRGPKPPSGRSLVEKVKRGQSKTSSLLQLADMVCDAVVHSHDASNPTSHAYRKIIQAREISVQTWPEK